MPKLHQWSSLPQTWIHIGLPGIRESARGATYQRFPVAGLPEIPIALDDECAWLATHGTRRDEGLHRHDPSFDPAMVAKLAAEAHVPLPASFRRFLTSEELQARVRSVTDCFLASGDRLVRTTADHPGSLFYFLSDSQSCVHWYLHVGQDGEAAVLSSPFIYCHSVDSAEDLDHPSCGLEEIELAALDFSFCAPSFSEFIYRFWIENEIWLASKESRRPLNELERAYADHYTSGG